jgi:hypothetical protein
MTQAEQLLQHVQHILQVLFEQEPSDFGALLQTEKEANAKHQVSH